MSMISLINTINNEYRELKRVKLLAKANLLLINIYIVYLQTLDPVWVLLRYILVP